MKLPTMTVHLSDGSTQPLSNYLGHPLVLYFYPKDNTPGCTQEAKDFTCLYKEFEELGVQLLGVSRDSVKSHSNYKAKYAMPFELISDSEGAVCEAFDVIKNKLTFGIKALGIERSTFLLDAKGQVIQEWRQVKVPNHAQMVLDVCQQQFGKE